MAILKKQIIKAILFVGGFAGIVMFFSKYIIPNTGSVTKVIIIVLLAMIGSLIGNTLFPKTRRDN